jgi:hypothetical protein
MVGAGVIMPHGPPRDDSCGNTVSWLRLTPGNQAVRMTVLPVASLDLGTGPVVPLALLPQA